MKSPANLMLLPYICFCSHEALNYMEYDLESMNIQTLIDYKKIRNKLKLFTERYGKSIRQVKSIDSVQNENFKTELRFQWMKMINIHYNLGVYCNSEGYIVGNTQYISFVLQNPKFNLKSRDNQDLYNLAVFLGSTLQMISNDLTFLKLESQIEVNEVPLNWSYKDYNTNKKFDLFPENNDGKELTLFLLHLLTTLNFVIYELPKYLDKENLLLFRINYITAHYVNESLQRIKNIKDTSKTLLEKEVADRSVFNSTFRSCMLHYGFYNKGECSIKDKLLKDVPFYGLIESCFEGKNFEEYCLLLNEKNFSLSKTILTILPFSTKNYRPL